MTHRTAEEHDKYIQHRHEPKARPWPCQSCGRKKLGLIELRPDFLVCNKCFDKEMAEYA